MCVLCRFIAAGAASSLALEHPPKSAKAKAAIDPSMYHSQMVHNTPIVCGTHCLLLTCLMCVRSGVTDAQFVQVFESVLDAVWRAFRPDAVVLQCGVDALASVGLRLTAVCCFALLKLLCSPAFGTR